MSGRPKKLKLRPFFLSLTLSAALLAGGIYGTGVLDFGSAADRLFFPLLRLLLVIAAGLAVGQVIEATGWTRFLGAATAPLFRFGNLGPLCSSAFITAFFSGAASNAMLVDFYRSGRITLKQLYMTNLANQFPAFFLHLPTTVFIIVPLAGWAGVLYLFITFLAALVRTALLFFYGNFRLSPAPEPEPVSGPEPNKSGGKALESIRRNLPPRIIDVATYVIPVYILVYIANALGFFGVADRWFARFFVTSFIPVEALSMVVLSFAAEFTSGFAAAGALMASGVLTIHESTLALLIGNIIAFPLRTIRHQLPRYIGIFSPALGTKLLLMGQGYRVISLVIAAAFYYMIG